VRARHQRDLGHDVEVFTVCTHSSDDTEAIGAALAPLLHSGDVVLLMGELGSGKTVLTRGMARALGSDDPVTSPTFTIMRHHHTATLNLIHMDAYRLSGPNEVEDLGLFELLDEGAVAVIEWGEIVIDALGPDHLDLRFHRVDEDWVDDDQRMIDVMFAGARWSADADALQAALAPWSVTLC